MQNEWEREKHKILNTLLGSGPDAFEFPQETEVKNKINTKHVFPVTLAQSSVHFYLPTLLLLLHQKKLFERKFVLLSNSNIYCHFTFK
jgi:hypothetical protein